VTFETGSPRLLERHIFSIPVHIPIGPLRAGRLRSWTGGRFNRAISDVVLLNAADCYGSFATMLR